MIRIEISGESATIVGPLPWAFMRVINSLSGRKVWDKRDVRILATAANLRMLKSCDHEVHFEDKTGELAMMAELEAMATQHAAVNLERLADYTPGMPLYEHQKKVLALSWERKNYALLLEMGLGKTAILIANAGMLFRAGKITGVLVIAPKGVHRQWLESELTSHLEAGLPHSTIVWRGKTTEVRSGEGLTFFAMNTDAIRTASGQSAALDFIAAHRGKVMLIADESHNFKSYGKLRTKALLRLGLLADYRRIATGTPIAKNIVDAWTQFYFLDPRILGHRYMSSFRARYCIMGGWEGKQIVGQKNTEEFYQLIAPHSYRLTKDEALDLPPKVYAVREYEMSAETSKHYKELKDGFMTQFADGSIVDVPTAAVALLRLQQIVCGSVPTDEGKQIIGRERLEQALEIVRQVDGPVIIWARFVDNIKDLRAELEAEFGESSVVTYFGETSPAERQAAVARFLAGEARFFVSNPAAGGVGLNLQGACRTVLYYSNDFNYINRIQSEDRVHRIGTTGSVTYFDLVAQKSVDRTILRNLKTKQDVARMTLDAIRQAISN